MKFMQYLFVAFFIFYLVPGLAAAGLWLTQEHPANWREAKWGSADILPKAEANSPAYIAVMAAKTGGFKGAFSLHSWLVVKRPGASTYDRYDVVGWGQPVRKNAYSPDGYWYSNPPEVVWQASGAKAEALIPKIEAAIAHYPHNIKGSYRLWPGPNSNTFVASILREVPEIDTVLPPTAIGRDYLASGKLFAYDPQGDVHVSLYGLVGFSAGRKSGFELHLIGLVAGFDFIHPGVKVPAWGTFEL